MTRGLNRGRAKVTSAYNGGANLHLPNTQRTDNVPQHGLDVALAQTVSVCYEASRRAAFVNGNFDKGRTRSQIAAMAKDMLRWLPKTPWGTLSAKQRAALEHCLKPEQLVKVIENAKAAAGIGRDAPECLWPENLPKKPPGRK